VYGRGEDAQEIDLSAAFGHLFHSVFQIKLKAVQSPAAPPETGENSQKFVSKKQKRHRNQFHALVPLKQYQLEPLDVTEAVLEPINSLIAASSSGKDNRSLVGSGQQENFKQLKDAGVSSTGWVRQITADKILKFLG